jgi:hypothetical protein
MHWISGWLDNLAFFIRLDTGFNLLDILSDTVPDTENSRIFSLIEKRTILVHEISKINFLKALQLW